MTEPVATAANESLLFACPDKDLPCGRCERCLDDRLPDQIRTVHTYGFRSGEWADLLSITRHAKGRECYAVRFDDGTSDFWPVDDAMAHYEFRDKVTRNV